MQNGFSRSYIYANLHCKWTYPYEQRTEGSSPQTAGAAARAAARTEACDTAPRLDEGDPRGFGHEHAPTRCQDGRRSLPNPCDRDGGDSGRHNDQDAAAGRDGYELQLRLRL